MTPNTRLHAPHRTSHPRPPPPRPPPRLGGKEFVCHVAAQAGGEGGRPPVPRGTGAGPSLPGLRSRAVVVPSSLRTRNHHAATVAGARHVPVSRTVLVESVCRQGGTHSGTVPTGRGSKGVAPQRGWHSSQRPHLRKVGHGSTRNFLANTRAPPSLRRARCGRTSTSVIVPRRAA